MPADPSPAEGSADLAASLLARCTFSPPGAAVTCGLSGGADSTAMTILAVEAGLVVTAIHIDHGLRPGSHFDAELAAATAARLGIAFRMVRAEIAGGPNLEARARAARDEALGRGALTGHTADDQAETLLLALIRGAGSRGLAAMTPGPTKPILRLRHSETVGLCAAMGFAVAEDPSNADPRFRRNRIRAELLPLLDAIAERDVTPLLTRTADLLRDEADLLDELAAVIDPTDARALATASPALARRAVRQWLLTDGYPPDAAAVERVLDVARGATRACEVAPGRRVERHRQRLRVVTGSSDAGR